MTTEEFMAIVKKDPRFKIAGKSISATLYVSPLDDLRYEGDDTIFVLDGETVRITAEESEDFWDSLSSEEARALNTKAIIINLILDPEESYYAALLSADGRKLDVSGFCHIEWSGN